MSQLFASDGQSIGVSASTSVLPMNIQDWFPLGWTGWIPFSPKDSQEASPTPKFKSISSLVLSFLYSPTLTSIESVMPSNHLILCRPLLPPSIFLSMRVFSNESVLRIRWPKYWSFSSNISLPINTQDWSPLEWSGWISLDSQESSPTPQFKSISSSVLSFLYGPTLTSIHDYCEKP